MKIEDAKNRARELMDKHNLRDWKLEFRPRMTSTYGTCWNKKKLITISKLLTKKERSKKRFDLLVLHEIAHALCYLEYQPHLEPYKNKRRKIHGKEFQEMYKSIGGDDFDYESIYRPYKWIASCPNCNQKSLRKRKMDIACGKCCRNHNGGVYDKRFKMVFSPVSYDKENNEYSIQ